MSAYGIFTSESVTPGHPDKLCDQLSDAIVDGFLSADPHARINAECAIATGLLFVAARFAGEAKVDIPNIARKIIGDVGYSEGEFNARDCTILTSLQELPPSAYRRIEYSALGEEELNRIGASHQVTVFGYACDQTPVFTPLPIYLAHKLSRQLEAAWRSKSLPYLGVDAQSQVAVEYERRHPKRIHGIALVASQREGFAPALDRLRADLIETVIRPAFSDEPFVPDQAAQIFVNPEGAVVGGGPMLHAGLTGRKAGIDTYGEYVRQSGSALSGKDVTRIDRIAAYAARYAAKNVVAAGIAAECEVQLSYTIGLAQPVSIGVETYGTARLTEEDIVQRLRAHFDFRPAGIVKEFALHRAPQANDGAFFARLAAYGHVGRDDVDLPWERLDKLDALRG